MMVLKLILAQTAKAGEGGGGAVLPESWVEVYSLLPKTLTLFMNKICDICFPFYDVAKNSIPY